MTAKIATIKTGVIATAAKTPTIFFCNIEPAVFFLILIKSLIISLIIEKNNIKKEIKPKTKKNNTNFGLLSAELYIE